METLETRTVLSASADTGADVIPSAAPPETARITLFVDSQQVAIPNNVGVFGGGGAADIFSSDANGQITFDPDNASTLGDFFDVWRTNAGLAGNNANATLSANQLLGNLANTAGDTVQMFVNGSVSSQFDDYVVQAGDEIVLAYGSNPIVALNTTYGPIVIELFEAATPGTVDNFLNYVNRGDYVNSFFHRSAKNQDGSDFVIQGGGFRTTSATFTSTAQFSTIPTDPPIQNEPGISNLRGTVAMAKTSNPNSATDQFFVNLNDTNTFLDNPNNSGGFTVFGQVLDMTTSDRIADLPVDLTNPSPYNQLPKDASNQLAVIQSLTGLGNVTGVKFLDANANGTFDTGEQGLAGVTIYIDANGNGVFDTGETSTTTDANGRYLLQLAPGMHTLRSESTALRASTVPVNPDSYPITIQIGRTVAGDRNFGESPVNTPSVIDLLPASDTGTSSSDNLTNRDNSTIDKRLQFQVSGVNNGASVRLFSGGTLVGQATADGTSVVVTTNGTVDLADGSRSITATQTVGSIESGVSNPLVIAIDTAVPTAIANTAPAVAQAGQLYSFDAQSSAEGQTGVVYSLSGQPSGMTINSGTGAVNWTPTISQAVPQSFEIRLSDSAGNATSQAVELTVLGVIPALADDYTTDEDTPFAVNTALGVLANDGDSGSGTLSAAIIDQPSHGTLSLASDGSFTYTPDDDFFGTDSFTYQASDSSEDSNVAKVTIIVNSVADSPTATDDAFTAISDGSIQTLDVLADDTSAPDGDQALSITAVTQGNQGGSVAIAGGQIEYTAVVGFTGTETFTYTIQDTDGLTDTATVTMTVSEAANNALSGFVYLDNDNDGQLDSGEMGVPGAVITLSGTDLSGASVSRTMMTGSNGFYQFDELPAGTYTLAEAQPKAILDGIDTTSAAGAQVANDQFSNIVLTSGQSIGDNNFGERALLPKYFSIAWFFATAGTQEEMLRESIAMGEEIAGNQSLANAIRAGANEVPQTPNTGPQAASDAYSVNEDVTLAVAVANSVLNNDSDAESDSLIASLVETTINGQLTLNANGSFTYVPNANFNGADAFTYRTSDGEFTSAVTTVTITVTAVNDAPVAVAESFSVDSGGVLNTNAATGVLTNDSDVDGNALTAQLVTSPTNGSVSLATNGSFVYSSDSGFVGTDTFTYQANDGTANSAVTTVTINVAAANDAPVATVESYSVTQDISLSVTAANGVLFNDTDADNDSLTAQLVSSTSNGTLSLASDGSFAYTPATGFVGTDSFTYRATDGTLTSNTVTVTIVVNRTNVAPVAVNDPFFASEDFSITISAANGVLANDTDGDGDSLTAAVVSQPTHGSLTFQANGGFTYTPDANFSGADTFTYRANDGLADSGIATVTITVSPTNDVPVAADDNYSITTDGTLTVPVATGVLQNDSDGDGQALSITVTQTTSNGTLMANADGSFTYTPNSGFHGIDSFAYVANDGQADSAAATVTILVNTEAIAVNESYSVDEDTTLNVASGSGVLLNDSDSDGDTLSAVLATNPSHGTLVFNADGSFSYTPDDDFFSTDSFTYVADDGFTDSAPATVSITVNPIDDVPVAADDSYSTDEDTPLSISAALGVLDNDTDADGDALTAVFVSDPANGTLSLNADGSFSYTPDADFHGTDTFVYRANDSSLGSLPAVVTINVNSAPDAPQAANDSYTTEEDQSLSVDALMGVLANDTDVDGDSLTAAVVENPANGTLSLLADGSFTYTPDADFSGTDSFTYRTGDGSLNSNTATVSLIVTPQNAFSVAENSPTGTIIGTVSPEGALAAERIFTLDDPELNSLLQLAADDHISGDPAAPVVLIEYLDLQCPICRTFHPIVEQLETEFAGNLLVVRRHFPLTNPHPNAFAAARAAEAAGRQGQFDAMVDMLFENQGEWDDASNPQSIFDSYATALGLNLTQFATDIADPTTTARIQRDLDAAIALSAPGTPTFFLDGQQISLPGSQQAFSDLVSGALANHDEVFSIDRLTGQLTVRDPAAFDFETSQTLNVDVRIADITSSIETVDVTVSVTDVDESPSPAPPEDGFAVGVDAAFGSDDDDWLIN